MKKLSILLVLLLCLAGCGTTKDTTGTVTTDSQSQTVADYFDSYEFRSYISSETGYVYVFDDGSEYGVALAIRLDQDQLDRIDALDFFADSYQEDLAAIIEESNDYTVTNLDECVPDASTFEGYVGKKVEDLMNDGYVTIGASQGDNACTLQFDNETYQVEITVEEAVGMEQDLSDEFISTLTIKTIDFCGFGDGFLQGLFD